MRREEKIRVGTLVMYILIRSCHARCVGTPPHRLEEPVLRISAHASSDSSALKSPTLVQSESSLPIADAAAAAAAAADPWSSRK